MSDHHHYGEYAETRHDHRGEHADERHDHDIDYAGKHHRHYGDERALEELRGQVRQLRAILIEFGLDLSEAQGRIRQLEDRQPDYAGPAEDPQAEDYAPGAPSPATEGRSLLDDLAEAACGGEPAWLPIPRLRKLAPDSAETGEEAFDAEG